MLSLRTASTRFFDILSRASVIMQQFPSCGPASLTELMDESIHQLALYASYRQDGEPSEVQTAQSETRPDISVIECYVFHHGEYAESYVKS